MKKVLLTLFVTLGLAISLWTFSSRVATAQGPVNDDWTRALYLYDRPYSVPTNMWVWFKFDYSGDRSKLIQLTLVNGHALGLDMRLYTADQALHITDDKFLARGNVVSVPCDTGKCESPDLFWQGAVGPLGGTMYVAVMNPTNMTIPFRLVISGDGFSLGNEAPPPQYPNANTPTPIGGALATTTPPFQVSQPGASLPVITNTIPSVSGPLATLTPLAGGAIVPALPPALPPVASAPIATATPLPPANNSPYFAVYIPDNRQQSIAANGELWYKFDYTGDKSQITIMMPNGNAWGYDFKIYTADQAVLVYTNDKWVGRGSAVNQPCATGSCTADDLTWIGNFNLAGTYYVRVNNNKPLAQTFVLRIVGTAVNIIGN